VGPLFRAGPITWLALLLVLLTHLLLFHSVWGQRVRAVGEHPAAAATAGIDPRRIRWQAVVLGGAIAGLAGAFLSLQAVGTFERGMSGGRGFIALAALIFGKWTPLGAFGAALFFGYAQALQTQLQFAGIAVPHEFIGMLPYLLTILVLAGMVGRARPPAAIGRPWTPEGER
jgi:simple sugar transport system permease protein